MLDVRSNWLRPQQASALTLLEDLDQRVVICQIRGGAPAERQDGAAAMTT
jgi:hypothetical protein